MSVANCFRGRCCSIEEWKPVVGFEGYYEVSNYGNVRSLDRTTIYKNGRVHHTAGRHLAISLNSQGYRKTIFSVNGKHATPRVCRLVAMAFIPNPNNFPQVNHKDENKLNDCADNLEWCDCKYNNNYGTAPMRRIEGRKKPINQFTLDGQFVCRWSCASDAEKKTGVYHSHIAQCCKGKFKQMGGYVWRYANQ